MKIVLDTNILFSDPRMEGGDFLVLLDNLSRVPAELWLPEVVLDELTVTIREHIAAEAKRASDMMSKLTKIAEGVQRVAAVEVRLTLDDFENSAIASHEALIPRLSGGTRV